MRSNGPMRPRLLMFKRGMSPPDRLSGNLTPPAERTLRLFARSGYKMLREMDKVKYYQLGLVSCGLITHYDLRGTPTGCSSTTPQNLAPPVFQALKACSGMKCRKYRKRGQLTVNISKVTDQSHTTILQPNYNTSAQYRYPRGPREIYS